MTTGRLNKITEVNLLIKSKEVHYTLEEREVFFMPFNYYVFGRSCSLCRRGQCACERDNERMNLHQDGRYDSRTFTTGWFNYVKLCIRPMMPK